MEENNETAPVQQNEVKQIAPVGRSEQLPQENIDYEREHHEFDADEDSEVKNFGRGSFRGRPWNSGGIRFRSRGFGPGGPGLMRGRGGPGPGQFFRGRGAPHGGRFGGPNFDPNWGPNHNMGGPGFNSPIFGGPPVELWVETKSEDGKSYFYHAITRETTWTRPEGPNVKVMTQADVEAMNAKTQQQNQTIAESNSKETLQAANSSPQNKTTPPVRKENESVDNLANQVSNGINNKNVETVSVSTSLPPPMQQQPNFFPGGPPHFSGPPFGMPPPGYGGFPSSPWGVSWGVPNSHVQEQPAKNLIIKPGVIDPSVIARAAEWSEHRAPDGRPYYYHSVRGESVWEKPQAIRDLEAARMAAHSGATPQSIAAQTTNTTTVAVGQTPIMSTSLNVSATPSFDSIGFSMKASNETNLLKNDSNEDVEKEKKKKSEQEKRKREEEEKMKQTNKVLDKSRPISSTPIAGTPWCVVWTGDGRVFFYNPSTRTSVWERPEDLLERADVDSAVSTPPDQLLGVLEKEKKKDTPPPVDISIRTESESSIEQETPNKKPKLAVNDKPIEKKVDVAKEAAIEAEVRAAKERALVPLDVRVKSFKEMLKEKDVSAFSTWEKELHKIVFDPRYLLLTSRERKQVFEKYVKERAEEERMEKRNKLKQKREDFRKLMQMANLHGKSSFSEFSQKYGKDDRYKSVEKTRERESFFNEFIVEVRKKEKEEKIYRKEQIRKNFIEMLRERADIDRHSRWPDIKKKVESDSRYRAVENSMQRENYFLDYCKIMKDEKRKMKDKERERRDRKNDKKDKEKVKDKESEGTRSNVEDKTQQKKGDDHEDGEHPSTSDDEMERLQKERDRQMRAEQSIKEREKEVQRTLATHLRDRDKEREHHKRDEAIRHFSALLADLVRNADLTWKEVKRQLRKDHRWELVENLDREDRERIFNEHIDGLMRKKRDKFREMLDELSSLELISTWKDIKKVIRDDARYLKYNNSEKCEREFKDYIKDKTMEAKTSLRELLQECKLVTHKSYETVKENSNHLKDIEEILKNDKRYLVLDHMSTDRTQIIMTYLEDLNKRGPPPPPTASESTRRK